MKRIERGGGGGGERIYYYFYLFLFSILVLVFVFLFFSFGILFYFAILSPNRADGDGVLWQWLFTAPLPSTSPSISGQTCSSGVHRSQQCYSSVDKKLLEQSRWEIQHDHYLFDLNNLPLLIIALL